MFTYPSISYQVGSSSSNINSRLQSNDSFVFEYAPSQEFKWQCFPQSHTLRRPVYHEQHRTPNYEFPPRYQGELLLGRYQ